MTAKVHPERKWATGVLVVSGLISLSFNTRHAFYATTLPRPLALGYGAGPVVLAAAQSHVVALQASRGDLVGGWRKAATFGLVIGALALSFLGIYDLLRVAVPDPIPGTPINEPAILTPIVVDLMAIAALHELLRPADPNPVLLPESTFESATRPADHATSAPLNHAATTPTREPQTAPIHASEPSQPTTPIHASNQAADYVSDQSGTEGPTKPATVPTTKPKRAKATKPPRGGRPSHEALEDARRIYRQWHAAGVELNDRRLSAETNGVVGRTAAARIIAEERAVRRNQTNIAK